MSSSIQNPRHQIPAEMKKILKLGRDDWSMDMLWYLQKGNKARSGDENEFVAVRIVPR